MTKVFIDSDIILDLLVQRNEYQGAAELFTCLDNGEVKGFTSPLVFANVHYILSKYSGKQKSIESLRKLRKILGIVTIDQDIVDEALFLKAKDFEDSLQFLCSEKNHLDFIITGNKKDYKESRLPALTATEFLKI